MRPITQNTHKNPDYPAIPARLEIHHWLSLSTLVFAALAGIYLFSGGLLLSQENTAVTQTPSRLGSFDFIRVTQQAALAIQNGRVKIGLEKNGGGALQACYDPLCVSCDASCVSGCDLCVDGTVGFFTGQPLKVVYQAAIPGVQPAGYYGVYAP